MAITLRRLTTSSGGNDSRVDALVSKIGRSAIFEPAGTGNTSRHVFQTVNGREYLARANDDATPEQLQLDLSADGSQKVFNLLRAKFDWDVQMAHHYKHGDEISVTTTTTYKKYGVKENATVAQLQKHPTDPTISNVDSAYVLLDTY